MKRLLGLFSLGILAVLVAARGHAVSVTGPNVSNDASGTNLLSFDLDVSDGSPMLVDVSLDGDTGPLTFNSILFNFSPEAFAGFQIELLGGAEFDLLGEVTDGLGTFFVNVTGGATTALIDFAPDPLLTLAGFEIGDPLGLSGAADWSIDVSGVSGGSFQIVLRPSLVPEPSTALLLALGLAVLARRRAAAGI